ncbi:MAG: DUF3025 domain-containing protein [Burkholderiales bacterium]|nr:DUF3025 domain-containing protein [Burkholderiales bacterium]
MDWTPDFIPRSPVFEPLHAIVTGVFGPTRPGRAELERLLERRDPPVVTARGLPLRLAAPVRDAGRLEDRYEARLNLRGELTVREDSWHDFFNVLVWLVFPLAKAALNARHYAELPAQRARAASASRAPDGDPGAHARGRPRWGNRSPAQDALTLFDEGGMIVASCDGELTGLMRARRWKALFHERRERVRSAMRFVVFDHAIFEKALAPFRGITARAIVLDVPCALLEAPYPELIRALDARAAETIRDPARLAVTRDLAPVPILGVPGWCAENERGDYYDDASQFRPGRGTT